jgi:hypothetical protein
MVNECSVDEWFGGWIGMRVEGWPMLNLAGPSIIDVGPFILNVGS